MTTAPTSRSAADDSQLDLFFWQLFGEALVQDVDDYRSHSHRAVGAGRTPRERAPGPEEAAREPIAVVGMSCRLPGAGGPPAFWELLREGRDGIGEVPADRWDAHRLLDRDVTAPGRITTARGAYLDDIAGFDADFFGMSPDEAAMTDPQQRLMLELGWEALEDAGIVPADLAGSRTGVFVGAIWDDYAIRLYKHGTGRINRHSVTGLHRSIIANRLSYVLGLGGPSLTVDAAQSSSLVAVHLAAESLRAGDCTLALAGGVNLAIVPESTIGSAKFGGLSPDGLCKTFDARANGYVRGEGGAYVALKTLSRAVADGDRIYCVIEGSAVNNDGATPGLTVPSARAQEEVVRRAHERAGTRPEDVQYVELHGTGTRVGDPVEAAALGAALGAGRPAGSPLRVGSAKTNVGHLEGAAGVVGLLKTVLSIWHRELPPSLNFETPNPEIAFDELRLRVQQDLTPWPRPDRPLVAGTSSFGMGGTNCHVVLREWTADEADDSTAVRDEPAVVTDEPAVVTDGTVPWPVSAKSPGALRDQARRLLEHLDREPRATPAQVGHALAVSRSVFDHRAVLIGSEQADFREALSALSAGEPSPRLVTGTAPAQPGRTVFVFPGQGSQWTGMGTRLMRTSPVFAEHLTACAAALEPYTGWNLVDVLSQAEGAPALEGDAVVQPALWAVMISLARLWEHLGVTPDAVVGHSQGEIAAAHIAGVLSLTDSARIVALRSRAITHLAGRGGMVSLPVAVADAEELVARWEGRVVVATVNGPSATVVAGDADALAELVARCEGEGIRARQVPVDYASHSPHVEALRDELLELLAPVRPREAEVAFYSTVGGHAKGAMSDTTVMDAAYWYENLRSTVAFEATTRALLDDGHTLFVEVSPHPVLVHPLQETAEAHTGGGEVAVTGTLRRDDDTWQRVLTSLATAHTHTPVPWAAFFPAARPDHLGLPTYPFQRQHFWIRQTGTTDDPGALGLRTAGHGLLRASVGLADGDGQLFTGQLSLRSHPWLADHAVHGTPLLPGTAFVELALHAGQATGTPRLDDLTLQAPLLLPAAGGVQLQMQVSAAEGDGRRTLTVHSRPDDAAPDRPWTRHATGTLAPEPSAGPGPAGWAEPAAWPPAGATAVSADALYDHLADRGYHYGAAFQGLTAAWRHGSTLYAEVTLADDDTTGSAVGSYGIHPALFDAVLHPIVGTGPRQDEDRVLLPFAWSGVRLHAVGARDLRVRITPAGAEAVRVEAADPTGQPVAEVASLAMRPVTGEQLAKAVGSAGDDHLFRLAWTPAPGTEALEAGRVAFVGPAVPPALVTSLPANVAVESRTELASLSAEDTGPFPDLVVATGLLGRSGSADDVPGSAREAVRYALGMVRSWLAAERSAGSRLVFVTRRAVAVHPGGETPSPADAAVWGLIRSAQAEHPGRFALVDLADENTVRAEAFRAALASGEPQTAVRDGSAQPYVPRLVREVPSRAGAGPEPAAGGTVLITGGTGTLGSLFARRYAKAGRAGHLLLAGRRGPDAPGARELAAELTGLGVKVTVAACDTADRDALAALLAAVPDDHPLTAVVHAAGVLDDATVASLTAEQVDRVFGPKADAAWHLHELTRESDLAEFVLFSSVTGVLGTPGQGNYAAANVFLDALAELRHAQGLPATSLAWGLWSDSSGMTGHMDEADLARMARLGIEPITAEEGTALFEAARASGAACLVPAGISPALLRDHLDGGTLPAVLRGLVRAPVRRAGAAAAADAAGLGDRLARLSAEEAEDTLATLVRTRAALVLGHASADTVDLDKAFKDLGFDSLTAVELRNRLASATGLRLAPTVVFSYPTPRELGRHLLGLMRPAPETDAEEDAEEDAHEEARIRDVLRTVSIGSLRSAGVLELVLACAGPARADAAGQVPHTAAAHSGAAGTAAAEPGATEPGAAGSGTDALAALDLDALVGLALDERDD